MDGRNERLMLSNELLAGHVNRYPDAEGSRFYVNPKYTLDLTLDVLGDDELSIRLDPDCPLPDPVSKAEARIEAMQVQPNRVAV
ncbi:MAG: hypothetical protein ABEL51_04995 [Salinibacter sp.]